MDLHLLLGYPLVVVAGLEVLLGIMLLSQNPRDSRVNRAVAVFSFASAAFSLTTALMYLRAGVGLDHLLFARLSWVGWFSIPAALQFVFYLRSEENGLARLVGWTLYPFWGVIFGLCLFTDLIVTDHYVLIPFENHPGPVENPARFIGGSLIVWLMIEIVRMRRQMKGIKRAQLNYFFYGTLIFATCGSLTAGFLQLFGGFGFEPGLAAYFSFPWVALTFYAITRYRLFDMRIVLSNTLGTFLLFGLFAGAQSGLFHLLAPSIGTSPALLVSLVIAVLIVFGTPFSNMLRTLVHRTVLQDRYLYQDVLRDSVKAIITILDFNELLSYLVDTIRKSLQTDSVAIYLKGNDGSFSLRHGVGVTTGADGEPTLEAGILDLVNQTGQVIVREELERILPEQTFGDLNRSLRSLDAEVVIPLRYKGQIAGVLTVGSKGNGRPYLQSDIDLLDTLACHAAIAIENARLYAEARRAQDSLQESEARISTLVEHSIQKYLSQ
jgi:uncharacterized membrane protein YoaK (UPF0700 family)